MLLVKTLKTLVLGGSWLGSCYFFWYMGDWMASQISSGVISRAKAVSPNPLQNQLSIVGIEPELILLILLCVASFIGHSYHPSDPESNLDEVSRLAGVGVSLVVFGWAVAFVAQTTKQFEMSVGSAISVLVVWFAVLPVMAYGWGRFVVSVCKPGNNPLRPLRGVFSAD